MRRLLALTLAPWVVGCVEVPEFPLTEPSDDRCTRDVACRFPPTTLFDIELLPGVFGEVDGNATADLAVGNRPGDEDDWGVFLLPNVGNSTDQGLFSFPFLHTSVRPQVVHIDEVGRVMVFGTDTAGAARLEIYRYDAENEVFVTGVEDFSVPLSLPASPDLDDPPPFLSSGDFNGDALAEPDVVIALGTEVFTLREGSSEFLALTTDNGGVVDDEQPLDATNADAVIRGMFTRPSPLLPPASFEKAGNHDILLAADGGMRRYTFAELQSDGMPKWRSILEYEPFRPSEVNPGDVGFAQGVMGSMASSQTGPAAPGTAFLWIFGKRVDDGSNGALDITTIVEDTGAGTSQPTQRYRWSDQESPSRPLGSNSVGTVATGAIGGGATADFAISTYGDDDSKRVMVLIDPTLDDVDIEYSADYAFYDPGFDVTSLFILRPGFIVAYGADGDCETIELTGSAPSYQLVDAAVNLCGT